MTVLDAGPDGEHFKANELSAQLAEEWNAMTPRQQKEATSEYIIEFEARREAKPARIENVEVANFHDARANLARFEEEVRASSAHTLH